MLNHIVGKMEKEERIKDRKETRGENRRKKEKGGKERRKRRQNAR